MLYTDVAVIGAGPAGMAAACEAARTGCGVLLIDESLQPGGQLMKQIHRFFGSRDHYAGIRGLNIGDQLYQKALSLQVKFLLKTVVWGYFAGELAILSSDERSKTVKAKKIIVATGASENTLPFPGWTLPGVMGAGAAQTLMNLHRVLPGKRVLMVGAGNVGLIVSYQLLQAGAEVILVVEAAPKIGGYRVHSDKIKRAGVPILTGHTVKEVRGVEKVKKAIITRVDENWQSIAGWEEEYDVDTVCLAVGLTPLTELLWLMGCEMNYDGHLGGCIPQHDENMETSITGIYVAGDITGIEEASVAMEEGRIAGIAAAEALKRIGPQEAGKIKEEARNNLSQLRSGPFAPGSGARTKTKLSLPRRTPVPILKENETLPHSSQALPVIECFEEIPCDPCAVACPFGCIKIGEEITCLPEVDLTRCSGCGLCVITCPGLAIFLVDLNYSQHEAAVTMAYEYLPLPQKGERVQGLDRDGQKVCIGEVQSVKTTRKSNGTFLVTIIVPKKYGEVVRHLKRDTSRPAHEN